MTSPTETTLYEVIAADHVSVAYFDTGDAARAFAATLEGSKVMIYLRPVGQAK